MKRRPIVLLLACSAIAGAAACERTNPLNSRRGSAHAEPVEARGGVLHPAAGSSESIPPFAQVRAAYRPSDARLLDRHGAVLHELRIDRNGRRLAWTPLADISPALQAAVVAAEDRRFFRHDGIDWWAVAGRAWQRLAGGTRRGASTISMQVAAQLDRTLRRGGAARTWLEKWRQMRAARALERRWTKAEILEAYLNLATFRGELQGVAAAAHGLFGKDPHGLGAAESAVLAALLRAPNARPAVLRRRAGAVVWASGELVPKAALDAAVAQVIAAATVGARRAADAPHVAQQLLAADPGDVHSTLDAALQRFAADTLRQHLLALRERNVHDGAVLVADNATGAVLAYVGSSGALSRARFVDGVRAPRQAGSTLKPFLYGLAFDRRLLTPASLLADSPIELAVAGGVYRPHNYDDVFRGLVSVRTALAGSLNAPAVRALELTGAEPFVQQLRDLGFRGAVQSGEYYGPSLALGALDVSLWELVNGYRTLANGGASSPLHLRPEGAVQPSGARRYSPAAAFLVADILADRGSRSATFGLDSALATRFWSAAKTGTSKDMRDNWCVGFSRRYTAGVWVGNFSGAPMHDVSGVTGAAPVWHDVMDWLHREIPSDPPDPPPGVRDAPARFPDGVEPVRREWFVRDTEPRPDAPLLAALPRILAPTDGSIIAIDPDIPDQDQRIAFAADFAADLEWSLDGIALGTAARPFLWAPGPGRHTLSLLDAQRRAATAVQFEVRGPRIRTKRTADKHG